MKSTTSTETRSEILEYVSSLTFGIFFGGSVASLLPNWGCLIFGSISVLCSFLNWRTGFASTKARAANKLDAMRYRGLYPPQGTGTDYDVKSLKAAGERVLATQLYRELHGGTLKNAIDTLDKL